MDIKQKNLIFQFIEELNSKNEKDVLCIKEKELLKKLGDLIMKKPDLENEITEIANLMISLNGDIKYKFYEYGIIAKNVGEGTNLEWRES